MIPRGWILATMVISWPSLERFVLTFVVLSETSQQQLDVFTYGHFRVPLRMNCRSFGDPFMSHLVPSSVQNQSKISPKSCFYDQIPAKLMTFPSAPAHTTTRQPNMLMTSSDSAGSDQARSPSQSTSMAVHSCYSCFGSQSLSPIKIRVKKCSHQDTSPPRKNSVRFRGANLLWFNTSCRGLKTLLS